MDVDRPGASHLLRVFVGPGDATGLTSIADSHMSPPYRYRRKSEGNALYFLLIMFYINGGVKRGPSDAVLY